MERSSNLKFKSAYPAVLRVILAGERTFNSAWEAGGDQCDAV